MGAAKARPLVSSVFVLLLLALDRITKILALKLLIPGVSRSIGAWFGIHLQLTLTTNEGAAWGAFAAFPGMLFSVRLLFIAGLLFFYWRYAHCLYSQIAVLAILAGAIGNILDSLFLGSVVDMIHVTLWGWDYPVFNLADTWIFLGCLTFLFGSFFEKKRAS